MATPEELNSNLIQQIAAQRLGPAAAPAAPAAPQQAAPQETAPAPTKPKADPSPTEIEKAQSKLAPKDEAAVASEEAVRVFKIGDKELSESQINGTMQRYRDLNFKWQTQVAPVSPVLEVVNSMMKAAEEAGHKPDGKQMAQLVEAAVKAYVKNPEMGKGAKQPSDGGDKPAMSGKINPSLGDNSDDDAAYEQWERENAVKLPPGFRDVAKANKEMSAKMEAMLNMMQTLLGGNAEGQKVVQEADAQMKTAKAAQAEAATAMIRNNLNQSFAQAQIPLSDEVRADFRMFAAQRGYDFPDFLDPELTATVIADYKANKDAPEMARLRAIAQKRQAFTGMAEGAPGAGAGAPATGDPMLASLVQGAMSKRGM